MKSPKVGLFLLFLALAFALSHGAAVAMLSGTDSIASLLSPGGHSPWLGLFVAAAFVVSRLLSLVVAPALGAAGAVQMLLSYVRRSDDPD